MLEQFKKHLDKFIKISDDEFVDITNYFELQK